MVKLTNKPAILIGLHGIAEVDGQRVGSRFVGKDTVAELMTHFSANFTHMALADPMYKILEHGYGIKVSPKTLTPHQKDTEIQLPWGRTIRQILQGIGDMFRAQDEQHFVKLMANRIDRLPAGSKVVVSDIRTETEASFVRENGGIIVHIHRDFTEVGYVVSNHNTENGILSAAGDLHLHNNLTKAKLVGLVEKLIKSITKGHTK